MQTTFIRGCIAQCCHHFRVINVKQQQHQHRQRNYKLNKESARASSIIQIVYGSLLFSLSLSNDDDDELYAFSLGVIRSNPFFAGPWRDERSQSHWGWWWRGSSDVPLQRAVPIYPSIFSLHSLGYYSSPLSLSLYRPTLSSLARMLTFLADENFRR